MSFDFENMRFTPDNHEVMESQTVKLAAELLPGDVRYVESTAIWVPRTDRKMWLNGFAPAYEVKDLYEMGATDERDYARLICIDEGLIVDFSHLEQYSWTTLDDRWERSGGPTEGQIYEERIKPLPVIHAIYNSDELGLVEGVLEEKYSIDLKGTELGSQIEAIMDALDDDEDDEDDEDFDIDGELDDDEDIAA